MLDPQAFGATLELHTAVDRRLLPWRGRPPSGKVLADAAQATGVMARMCRVTAEVERHGALTLPQTGCALLDGDWTGRPFGPLLDPQSLLRMLLVAAAEADVLAFDEREEAGACIVVAGPRARDVRDRPLSVWSRVTVGLAVHGGLRGLPRPRWYEPRLRLLAILLFQRVVKATRDVDLAAESAALRDEIAAETPEDERPPTRREVLRRVTVAAGILRDTGVVEPGRSRRVRGTPLGAFGWTALRALGDRSVEQLLEDGGHLHDRDADPSRRPVA